MEENFVILTGKPNSSFISVYFWTLYNPIDKSIQSSPA